MDWLQDHLWETWLGIAIVLGIAEMFSLDLFLLMLGVGALGGSATALAGGGPVLQVIVAATLAVAMLGLVRPPLVRRLHGGPDLMIGHSTLVGARALVTEPVAPHRPGRVKVGGESWLAEATEPDAEFTVGATVEIREVRGATAYVQPVTAPTTEE